jgi:hypothetical protein
MSEVILFINLQMLRKHWSRHLRLKETLIYYLLYFDVSGSISNIGDDTEYKCKDGTSPEVRHKVISGVVGAASSVTSIQVANLLRLFKIPQVKNNNLSSLWKLNWVEVRTSKSCY